MATRFEWPSVLESSEYVLIGSRVFEPFLQERRDANQAVWGDRRHWRFGFYFGRNDSRLWVPRRSRSGAALEDARVINFGHPLGRKAFRILMFGYGTGFLTLVAALAVLFGARW